ncbi:MAG: DUF998 domain-containing protein [Candidatus Hodarchaeales archaeon]|jgi:hypothetical membrane protein
MDESEKEVIKVPGFAEFTRDPKYATQLTIVAFIIYYSFILFAAVFYPGGYDFVTDYYSDLGRTFTSEGDPNTLSLLFFVTGTLLTGLMFIPFWLTFYTLFHQSRNTRLLGKLGSTSGILALTALYGIALIPINIILDLHAFFSVSYYLTITFSLCCYSAAMLLQSDYPNYNGVLGLLIAVFELLFIIGFFSEIEPLIQKITSLCFALWLVLQYSTIRRIANSRS